MCKVDVATLRALLLPLLLSGMVWAQAFQEGSEYARPRDVFAEWRANVNDAADRVLAATVADKAWMKTGERGADGAALNSNQTAKATARIRAAIQRVQLLRPTIEPFLRQEGIPSELSAVVLVESGGQPSALSPKGARGIWQFMPETARRYGLAVGAGKDERTDVAKSTRAAARYLRDLHDRFGSWPFALAAYNAGEDAVQRAIERTGATDFAELGRSLPPETRRYVPGVLSAAQRIGVTQLSGSIPVIQQSESGRRVYASAEVRE